MTDRVARIENCNNLSQLKQVCGEIETLKNLQGEYNV